MAPSSRSYPQSEQQIMRLAARPTRKTFIHYCPVYFAGLSCNSPLFHTAKGNGVKHKCCQKKGKVEETAWDLSSTASILQLYIFFAFRQKCWWFLWKCWLGCEHMNERDAARTGWVSPTSQLQMFYFSAYYLFGAQCLLLDGKFLWERKIPVKLIQEYQSHELLKIIPGHLFREKREEGWREW